MEKERMKLGHCLGHRFKFPSALLDARKEKLSLLSSHILFQICREKKTVLDDLACLENCHKKWRWHVICWFIISCVLSYSNCCSTEVVGADWWSVGMVVCLELVADLHVAQLMPVPFTVSCFSRI